MMRSTVFLDLLHAGVSFALASHTTRHCQGKCKGYCGVFYLKGLYWLIPTEGSGYFIWSIGFAIQGHCWESRPCHYLGWDFSQKHPFSTYITDCCYAFLALHANLKWAGRWCSKLRNILHGVKWLCYMLMPHICMVQRISGEVLLKSWNILGRQI